MLKETNYYAIPLFRKCNTLYPVRLNGIKFNSNSLIQLIIIYILLVTLHKKYKNKIIFLTKIKIEIKLDSSIVLKDQSIENIFSSKIYFLQKYFILRNFSFKK